MKTKLYKKLFLSLIVISVLSALALTYIDHQTPNPEKHEISLDKEVESEVKFQVISTVLHQVHKAVTVSIKVF